VRLSALRRGAAFVRAVSRPASVSGAGAGGRVPFDRARVGGFGSGLLRWRGGRYFGVRGFLFHGPTFLGRPGPQRPSGYLAG